jgi:hypothetical protein
LSHILEICDKICRFIINYKRFTSNINNKILYIHEIYELKITIVIKKSIYCKISVNIIIKIKILITNIINIKGRYTNIYNIHMMINSNDYSYDLHIMKYSQENKKSSIIINDFLNNLM